MARNEKKALHWVRLDNAAKIYPAARRRNWSSIYRQSMTLRDEVDVTILRSALDVTIKRFPSIAARLRRGVFWYYLEQIESAPEICEEKSCPLVFMNNKEIRKCAFRVIVYRNRIAIELFHALTDGTGAMIFLKTLVAEYLEQKYGISIPNEDGILDRHEKPTEDELEDSFLKYAGKVAASRKSTNAWHLSNGSASDVFLNLTCFLLPVKETIELAHKHGTTLTVFLSAVMMKALINLQKEKVPFEHKRERIKLMIPINLRKLFPSKTLRNFAMYTIPELDPRLGEYTFDEICKIIYHKMGAEFTAKYMSTVIATNVKSERNTLIRLIPLPLKNLVMKAIFNSVGEIKSCLALSNLGVVKMPDIMRQYVERMDFIVGVRASAPYNCGVVSFGDTIYVNFIRSIPEPELERHFFAVLHEMGLPVTVESNRNFEV